MDHGNGGGSPWKMVEGVTGAVLHGSGRQAGARERAARWWRVASSWVWRSSRLSRSGGIDCGGWTERRAADSEERPAVRSGSGEQRRLHSKEWQYRSSHVQQQPATGRRTAGRLSA